MRVRLSDLHWINGFVSREGAIDQVIRTIDAGIEMREEARKAEEARKSAEARRVAEEANTRRTAAEARRAEEAAAVLPRWRRRLTRAAFAFPARRPTALSRQAIRRSPAAARANRLAREPYATSVRPRRFSACTARS